MPSALLKKTLRLAWMVSLVVPLAAFARFGGGHHFHSSHHSYSHHSSSWSHHSSSFPSSHSYYYGSSSYSSSGGLGFCGGLLVVLVLIAVVAFLAYRARQQNGESEGGGPEAPDPLEYDDEDDEDDGPSPVELLRKTDPQFDLQALLDRAKEVFLRAQAAWSARDLEPIRALMSDASFQRFSTQLALMKAQNVRNVTADATVRDIGLAGVEQSQSFDTVHVRIEASLRDVDLPWNTPDAEAAQAAARAESTDFVEYWSFVRRPGAQTKPGATVLQGKCPNCGAPFKGGASNKCDYCGAVVSSGNYDWTLAEITQSSEARSARDVPPGLEDLRESDPAFSLEMLEDRASLIFWKWVEAQSENQPEKLSKLAKPEQVSALRRETSERKARGAHRAFLECAVGAVDTVSLSAGASGQRASVEIRWSAKVGDAPEKGPVPRLESESLGSRLVLERGADAKTKTENGMSTNRCPNCSAPLTDSQSTACDFCGHPLASGKDDWVLARIESFDAASENDDWDEGDLSA